MSKDSYKDWTEMSVLLVGALGIGTVGFLSENLSDTVSSKCPETKNSENVKKAGNVAIGTAIGIIIMAIANKFGFSNSVMGRSGLLILISLGMIIIGAISLSLSSPNHNNSKPPANQTPEPNDDQTVQSTEGRLGSILLGFGLGILVPTLIKLFLSMKNKNPDGNVNSNNEIAVAFGTFTLSIFATIVGSWSWNNFNKCKDSKTNTASVFNGIATIVSALLSVYCIVFGYLRATGSGSSALMSNFVRNPKQYVKDYKSKSLPF